MSAAVVPTTEIINTKTKATLPSSMQPANPYDKGTPERNFFGLFVNWFYFSRGPFPNDSADETGAVPLMRLLSTATAKKFLEKHPEFTEPSKIKEVLEGAFEIIERSPTNIRIKAIPHAHSSLSMSGGYRKSHKRTKHRKSKTRTQKQKVKHH